MRSITLIRTDINTEEININCTDEVLIGRGPLLQCNEKRISRKHGLLKLTEDGSLILEAMHNNPCFHKNRNTSLEAPLFKGQTVKLKTGDQFGLLQDSFWYRVLVPEPKITKNILEQNALEVPADTTKGPHIPVADNPSCVTVTNEPSDVAAHGPSPVKRKLPAWMSKYQEKIARNVSPKKLKTERNPTPNTSALKALKATHKLPPSCSVLSLLPPIPLYTQLLEISGHIVSPSHSGLPHSSMSAMNALNRSSSLLVVLHVFEAYKITGHTMMYALIFVLMEIPLELNKITNESAGTSEAKKSNAKKNQRVQSKAHQMSQSGDEETSMTAFDGHEVKKEQDAQSKVNKPSDDILTEGGSNVEERKDQPTLHQMSDDDDDGKLSSDNVVKEQTIVSANVHQLSDDDDDHVDKLSLENGQQNVLKEETTASANVHQLSDDDTDLSDTEDKAEFQTKTGESKNLSKDSKDRCGTNDQDDTTPASNSTRRAMCIYGHKCFRKHPDHKKKFSHPGDIDYDTAYANLPECPYGLGCYRKHKGHWQAYKHTKVHQRKPRKTHGKSSEEDDYDLNDSFLNDGSSDDYQPTDLGSDSDSVSDEVDEPDMKRMKKEAKKFVKK
uniref:PBZ-type domain-containing protein n=1 Tax=Timema genevievae TaxID=629358 RepID=A0A7R9K0N6_TIMGE|nr:unnamed protein product [Timema genevievae]